ncbi:hypothetical protein DPMN_118374 [Dreissena polymorpha]|uniref:Uncharacterized protein n=1 Tax=Dreissena polymorpha TaxID=45954 RepID=A0A9D4GJZ3_DREPO|nr:hypothetical protein DPMN_118374 [Dreissena polymorpha]
MDLIELCWFQLNLCAEVERHGIQQSDSGLHHSVSLMYEGDRHIGFGTTFENKMAAPSVQMPRRGK